MKIICYKKEEKIKQQEGAAHSFTLVEPLDFQKE